MQRVLLTAILISAMMTLSGQAENASYKIALDKFEFLYSIAQYDSIFAMFSKDMKKSLPAGRAADFFSGLFFKAGRIINRQLMEYHRNYALYETNFEKVLFSLDISINGNSEISGLTIKPFAGGDFPGTEDNITAPGVPFKDR